jgi:hypothetical protein
VPDPAGGERQVVDAHVQRPERVLDRGGESRGAAARHALGDLLLRAERGDGGWGVVVVDVDRRELHRARHQVVHHRPGEKLALGVVHVLLVDRVGDPHGDAAVNRPLQHQRVHHPTRVADVPPVLDPELAGLRDGLDQARLR